MRKKLSCITLATILTILNACGTKPSNNPNNAPTKVETTPTETPSPTEEVLEESEPTIEEVVENDSEEVQDLDVTSDDLVPAVEAAIEGTVGEGEEITGVTFDGSDLKITVDMSGAKTDMFPVKDIAESRISSITDAILELNDSYYNLWETITIDFGTVGSATLDKTIVVDDGFGKYFDFPVGILK